MNVAYSLMGAACRRFEVRGRNHLARWLMRHPAHGTYRDSLGYRRRVNLADPIEAKAFLGVGIGMPSEVLARVSVGDTVIDAGANVGVVTAQLCRRVGPTGQVVAIDPLPANAERLRSFRRDNDVGQLRIIESALSDHAGSAELRYECESGETSPYASFSASWIDGGSIIVPTRTLDEVVEGPVTLLKLDVEGAESLVLDGATKLLAEYKPAIYCEFNDIVLRDGGSSAIELLEHFARLDYGPAPSSEQLLNTLNGAVTDLLMLPRE